MDTAKFDDAYFKAAEKKKGSSKKTEGEFFNEVCGGTALARKQLPLLTPACSFEQCHGCPSISAS